jgi:integrase/recombinase XerD
MTLGEVIDAYVALQRARGVRFEGGRALLSQFRREMGDPPIDNVCAEAVVSFLQGRGALSATWLLKYRVLSGLYRFAIGRGHVDKSPLPVATPKLPLQQTPYVYSNDELRRLLAATTSLHVAHSPLRAPMYRALLLLLYGSGLRIGEALRLTLRDVDLDVGVITVRYTKFYKSRLVPVGPKLAQELAAFAALRRRHPLPDGEVSPFFTTRAGRGCSYQAINIVFQRLRRAAGIVSPPGESKPPRLHDLRHTAAVHRVIAWYRSGQDVQRLLPHLATYLGHIDVKSTQRYLKMTPELLHEASQRFSSYSQWGQPS